MEHHGGKIDGGKMPKVVRTSLLFFRVYFIDDHVNIVVMKKLILTLFLATIGWQAQAQMYRVVKSADLDSLGFHESTKLKESYSFLFGTNAFYWIIKDPKHEENNWVYEYKIIDKYRDEDNIETIFAEDIENKVYEVNFYYHKKDPTLYYLLIENKVEYHCFLVRDESGISLQTQND